MRWLIGSGVLAAVLLVGFGGCSQKQNPVPGSAVKVKPAVGGVSFVAKHDGKLYVYNNRRDEIVYVGDVRRGQTVLIDAWGDQILIDGRTVGQRTLGKLDQYEVFLDPLPPMGPAPMAIER